MTRYILLRFLWRESGEEQSVGGIAESKYGAGCIRMEELFLEFVSLKFGECSSP